MSCGRSWLWVGWAVAIAVAVAVAVSGAGAEAVTAGVARAGAGVEGVTVARGLRGRENASVAAAEQCEERSALALHDNQLALGKRSVVEKVGQIVYHCLAASAEEVASLHREGVQQPAQ